MKLFAPCLLKNNGRQRQEMSAENYTARNGLFLLVSKNAAVHEAFVASCVEQNNECVFNYTLRGVAGCHNACIIT